jgi:hypothetical protein
MSRTHPLLDPFPLVYTGRLVDFDRETGITLLFQTRGTSRGRQFVHVEIRIPRGAGLEWFCDYPDAVTFLGSTAQYRWSGRSALAATLTFEPTRRDEPL